MGIVPTQSVGTAVPAALATAATNCEIAPALLDQLWHTCEAEACGLTRPDFEQMLLGIGMSRNFGLPQGLAAEAAPAQQAAFFSSLRIADLVLARACASGNERAWERFLALYREPLLRAGVAITGNDSLGRELADSLYAELYGLNVREGERRCPLDTFSGRGSLIGWLRTTLAQRHVDHHRRTHREQPLDESVERPAPATAARADHDPPPLPFLASAVQQALDSQTPEEKFLLASYYLDGRKLHEIAALLDVHEATVSRKLKRVTTSVRKQILRALERRGLSRRAAEEALATDPRDLTGAHENDPLGLKELLQTCPAGAFKEKA